jgi:hypothetical protein
MPENRKKTGFRGPGPDVGKATRWKPGQSGNPGGRPHNDLAAQITRGVFEADPEGIRQAILKAIKKGNPKMLLVAADRAYGRLPQALEVDLNATLHSLSDKELAAKLAALRRKEKG